MTTKQQKILQQLIDCGFLSPIKSHLFEGLQEVFNLDSETEAELVRLLSMLCFFDINNPTIVDREKVYNELLAKLNFPKAVEQAQRQIPGNTFYTLSIDESTLIVFSSSQKQFIRTIQKVAYSMGSMPVIINKTQVGRKQIHTALFVSYLNFPIFTKN